MILSKPKIITCISISIYSISLLLYSSSSSGSIFTGNAQSDLATIKHKNLIIEEGNNLTANSKLAYCAVG
ncbi:MAG TPA: hypothetical protein VD815_08570 [Candidatus Saccharimonadales bacterium]|nr:hypothetical protein [Candidatus Saccharimonadales bacterium]